MRRRPVLLVLCGLLFLYYPALWGWRLYNGQPFQFMDAVISGVLPLILLIGVIKVVKAGWYSLVAFGLLWGTRDLYQHYQLYEESLAPLIIHMSIYLLSLMYFINPRIRHLYFDPKLRWWRAKQRFETHGPLMVRYQNEWHYPILRNISTGGCFVETPHSIGVNEHVELTIPLPVPLNVSVIQGRGEVRWNSNDPIRPGFGVQFEELDRETKKALSGYVREQL